MPHVKKHKKAKGITIRLLISTGIFLASVFLIFSIIHEVLIEKETWMDEKIFAWLAPFRTPSLTKLMLFITFFGSQKFLLPAYLLVTAYYLFIKKNTRLSFDIVAISLAGTGLLFVMKDYFQRARPIHPLVNPASGFSFPSGHSFSVFTFFGILIYVYSKSSQPRYLKALLYFLFICLSFLVAFSRVYLQVHYASDIAAGFCLSLAWLLSSFYLFSKINGDDHSPLAETVKP